MMLAIVCQTVMVSLTLMCAGPMPERTADALFQMLVDKPIAGMSQPAVIYEDDELWEEALKHVLEGEGGADLTVEGRQT